MSVIPDGGSGKWTLTAVGGALILAVLGYFLQDTRQAADDVKAIVPKIEQLERTVDTHSVWIADWPTNGELSADVRQNTKIEHLEDEIDDLEQRVEKLRDRVIELERQ